MDDDIVQVQILDMDTFAGIIDFVQGVRKEAGVIDIILLDAEIYRFSYPRSPD
jgi:hypothetical protein